MDGTHLPTAWPPGIAKAKRRYFFLLEPFLQVQSLEGLPQDEQTPFSIGAPQVLHGVHPQV
jgi:hypothetical protein